ncbi:MAG: hypothetical protein INR66_03015 [Gordonia polyisoprenivorans]|nr:hypothetical protein [Gordonia polyisoprenivorans]
MDVVSSLLGCARGRVFCAEVGFVAAAQDRRPAARETVLSIMESVDPERVAGLPESDVLEALGATVDSARYWQQPDGADVVLTEPQIIDALRPIAQAVLRSPFTQWWDHPVALNDQRVLGYARPNESLPESTLPYRAAAAGLDELHDHVESTEARFRARRQQDPEMRVSNEWWSIPLPSYALETTRAHPAVGAVQLAAEEDTSIGEHARLWPVRIASHPRVFEIFAPDDWARLVVAHPIEVTESKRSDWFNTTGEYRRWFIPDWVSVARDYDAVHLSVIGYLTTAGMTIPINGSDDATLLAGWNPDATWWLNLSFVDIEDHPTTWTRPDQQWMRNDS